MAIPWLAVLQAVPWADVIKNAPKVAEGAKKLWSAVNKKSSAQNSAVNSAGSTPASADEAIALLQQRVAAMEIAASELHGQMLASAELLKSLAEQNAQLVRRIEENRNRLVWFATVMLVTGIVAVFGLVLLLAR